MPKIFISYRRDDSAGYVGRLYDKVKERFGEKSVFMDINAIQPGEDFVEVIDQAVTSCDVLLAVLGKQWLTITDANGNRRIDNPNDFVRLEVASALRRDVRVIPVLVRGASMPPPAQLPADLQLLSRRNAHEVSDKNFHRDVDSLLDVLEQIKTRKLPLRRIAALLMVIVLAVVVFWVIMALSADNPPSELGPGPAATDTPALPAAGIQPVSGRWQIVIRPDPHPACGNEAGQVIEGEENFRYDVAEGGDLFIRYVGEENMPEEYWKVDSNVYLQGNYEDFFVELNILAPDHLEEYFSHPSEMFGVPPEDILEDPVCRGTVSYFLIEPF